MSNEIKSAVAKNSQVDSNKNLKSNAKDKADAVKEPAKLQDSDNGDNAQASRATTQPVQSRNINFIQGDDNKVFIEVTDSETEQVIRRIPSDAVDSVVKHMQDFSGKIINTKA